MLHITHLKNMSMRKDVYLMSFLLKTKKREEEIKDVRYISMYETYRKGKYRIKTILI